MYLSVILKNITNKKPQHKTRDKRKTRRVDESSDKNKIQV